MNQTNLYVLCCIFQFPLTEYLEMKILPQEDYFL